MRSFNKVMLLGNLTADPVTKATKTGNGLTTFSLATHRDWKNKDGEEVNDTSFHRIVAFGKLGETICTYLKKGAPVLLSGRLNTRKYLGRDGKRNYITEIVAEDFNFLPRTRLVDKDGVVVEAQASESHEEVIPEQTISEIQLEEIASRFQLNKAEVEEVVDY